LPAGHYTFTSTDNAGCSAVDTFSLSSPPLLQVNLVISGSVSCYGGAGELTAHATGGTPLTTGFYPYAYSWMQKTANGYVSLSNPYPSDSIYSSLPAGTYIVTVTDNNGITARDSIILSQPDSLMITGFTQSNASCYGSSDGKAAVSVGGGTQPYSYSWTQQGGNAVLSTAAAISNLPAGAYTVAVSDRNGCTVDPQSVTITQPSEPLTVTLDSVKAPLQFGSSDGKITVSVSGGTSFAGSGKYSYQWINAATGAPITTGITTFATDSSLQISLSALPQGNYLLTVNDSLYNAAASQGCTVTADTFKLKQPEPLTLSVSVKDSILCHGGGGILAARGGGGVQPYTFTWKKKDSAGNYQTVQTSRDSLLTNVPAGSYSVNIRDLNNITLPDMTITLVQPDTLLLSIQHTDATCYGYQDGTVSVTVSGGTPPCRCLWSGTDTQGNPVALSAPGAMQMNNLPSGDYTVTVTDSHSCTARQTVSVSQPSAPLQIIPQSTVIPTGYGLSNGSLAARIEGGTPLSGGTYHTRWTTANGSPVAATASQETSADAAGCTVTLSGLPAGTYLLTVTDSLYNAATFAGCSAMDSFVMTQPPPLEASLSIAQPILCYDDNGALSASVTGGVPFGGTKTLPYRYVWKMKNVAGVYETMTDKTDSTADNLPAGSYAFNAADANGITLKNDLLMELPQPAALKLAMSSTPVGCAQGSAAVLTMGTAAVRASGATPPYRYEWSWSATSAGDTLNNLPGGIYMVRVTDANGCTDTARAKVALANGMDFSIQTKDPTCYNGNDGTITVSMTGNNPPFTYRWDGSASLTNTATGLVSGKYILYVTDNTGCTVPIGAELLNPAPVTFDLGKDRYICSGQSITYTVNVPDKNIVAYRWTGDNGFASDEQTVTLTQAGTYTATAVDDKGCSGSATVKLTASDEVISNEFALPTQAFAGEEIIVVNTSYPAADSSRWILPSQAAVEQDNQTYASFTLADTGKYTVELITYKGMCYSDQSKELIVSQRANLNDPGDAQTPFITSFKAAPNPSNGSFMVQVTLQEKADIQLSLIDMLSNHIVDSSRQSGLDSYTVPMNVSLAPGGYLLLLETPKGSATLKLIIM
jgi:hypothetical protein